jgi:hypothetical protein
MNEVISTVCLVLGGAVLGIAGILKLLFSISAKRGGDAVEKFFGNVISLGFGGIGTLIIFAPAIETARAAIASA